jgi:hypothetical protein
LVGAFGSRFTRCFVGLGDELDENEENHDGE